MSADPVSDAIAHAFREDRAMVLATLIRQAGDFQLAEDAVQDAFEAAVAQWRRDGETEITDGPFAVTKEILAGYYILDCADLDEALKQAERLPMARWATIEVRPVMPADEWLRTARAAGVDMPDEAVDDLK